jgi:prepilin-type N-terminal cleavage/methylation domain-containing protein
MQISKIKIEGQRGFTMIETILAVLIILTGVVGAYGIITNLTSYGMISPNRLSAVYLAKEGIEVVRNIRDTNWLNSYSWDNGLVSASCSPGSDENSCIIAWDSMALQSSGGAVPPLKIDSNGRYNYASGTATIFTRKIKITKPASGYLLVEITVNWSDKGKPYSLMTRERLYNWYKI